MTKGLFVLLKGLLGLGNETVFADVADPEVAAARRANFDRLWSAAERVKEIGFGRLEPTSVRVVVGEVEQRSKELGDAFVCIDGFEDFSPSTNEVVVTAEDLRVVAQPVLSRLAALAGGIARAGWEASGGETVDRVAFSGGSLLATYIRSQLEARLRRSFSAEEIGGTFVTDFDPTYCKTGTALGAMLLNSFDEFAPGPDDSKGALMEGRRLVDVDISKIARQRGRRLPSPPSG